MNKNTCNYSVKLDLGKSGLGMSGDEISSFRFKLTEMGEHDPALWDICSLDGETLRYQSETIYPPQDKTRERQKVLLVFGNPAIHSIKNGMFFYSRSDGSRHPIWSKLASARLIKKVEEGTRGAEAEKRREIMINGATSPRFKVGLTTFYSFPTPAADKAEYSGVGGLEELFKPVLDKLRKFELNRILRYPFTKDAILVFTQKSSHEWFCKNSGIDALYWPIRGKGSGGDVLRDMVREVAIQLAMEKQSHI